MTRKRGPQVALATCAEFASGPEDTAALVAALERRGVAARWTVWDDPSQDWAAYALVVVRSTWDYIDRRDRYLDWAESVPRLANPAEVLRWNTDKRYLADLARAGLPVVDTTWLTPGGPEHFVAPTGEYVVKPTVSAGSRDTARYGPGDVATALAHVAHLHGDGRTVMVQPYLEAVDASGEAALIFIEGRFSHGIRKSPMLARGTPATRGRQLPESISARPPTSAEITVAEKVLAVLALPGGGGEVRGGSAEQDRGPLLYARVDLLPGAGGDPVILEVELTEPSLFLSWAEGAVERLAGAITARVGLGP